jgi:ABC-type molybdate transport system ATPase subunit
MRAYNIADRIITLHDGRISPWTPENVFRLTAKLVSDGTELLTQSGLSLYYPHRLIDGRHYGVTINPHEVVISMNKYELSAQNRLEGNIRKIESISDNLAGMTVECAVDFIIVASVTSRTIKSFNCTVGDKVWVNFKSSALHVLE